MKLCYALSFFSAEQDDYFAFVEGDRVPCGRFPCFAIDKSVRFYILHIVSPDEFYVQAVSSELYAAHVQRRREMKLFYEYEENQKPLFTSQCCPTGERYRGVYCVYRQRDSYSENLELQRCVIVGWREAPGASRATGLQRYEAQVRFVDWGRTQWVPAVQLWKIESR